LKKIIQPILLIILAIFFVAGITAYFIRNGELFSKNSSERKNLIIISIDTLRADSMGVYGYKKNTTPYIDNWAKNATVFTNAYTHVPNTYPSVASLMTGLSPFESSIFSNLATKKDQHGGDTLDENDSNRPLDPSTQTLAQILKKTNYSTGAFVANYTLSKEFTNLDRGFDTYELDPSSNYKDPRDDLLTKHAFEWIDQNAGSKNPFFLWVHYMAPHVPYTPPKEYACKFNEAFCGEIEREGMAKLEETRSMFQGCTQNELDPQTVALFKTLYDGEVAEDDVLVGMLLDKIREAGLDKNSVIVFWGDHGEGFENKFYFAHGNVLYDSSTRTPLIIYTPDGKAGTSDILVKNEDIFWTVLNLLDINIPNAKKNSDFSNVVTGRGTISSREPIFYLNVRASKFGVRKENYKYIFSLSEDNCSKQRRSELYDIQNDPFEKKNIADEKKEVVSALHKELMEYLSDHPLRGLQKDVAEGLGSEIENTLGSLGKDQDTIEKLKSLGY
jgi:arylsulfatase A-like enzyme